VAPTGGSAALLDWDYTTDGVGKPSFIDDLLGGVDRDYAYQDVQFFLTQGDGPRGTLDWTYDRIGSRLTERPRRLDPPRIDASTNRVVLTSSDPRVRASTSSRPPRIGASARPRRLDPPRIDASATS
jgi:hypothetical protein